MELVVPLSGFAVLLAVVRASNVLVEVVVHLLGFVAVLVVKWVQNV